MSQIEKDLKELLVKAEAEGETLLVQLVTALLSHFGTPAPTTHS